VTVAGYGENQPPPDLAGDPAVRVVALDAGGGGWLRVLGRLAAGDGSAYTYLPASVLRFPPPEELKGLMEQAGLRNVRYNILAGGIIALHYAIV